MTKTKSHWFRMVYIEVQDKKTQVQDDKTELQAVSFYWYSIGTQSVLVRSKVAYQQKINKRKKPIT